MKIAIREDEPKLHIIMYSSPSLPFIVSVTHWVRLRELEPMYREKTTTARHQCTTQSVLRTPRTWGVLNDYLNPNSSSMKMIAWNCHGAGNVAFQSHAYKLHRRHHPQILIIVEPRIVEKRDYKGFFQIFSSSCSQFKARVILALSLQEPISREPHGARMGGAGPSYIP
nr:hypothetical protein CFP56_61896 [Quercus suber]